MKILPSIESSKEGCITVEPRFYLIIHADTAEKDREIYFKLSFLYYFWMFSKYTLHETKTLVCLYWRFTRWSYFMYFYAEAYIYKPTC